MTNICVLINFYVFLPPFDVRFRPGVANLLESLSAHDGKRFYFFQFNKTLNYLLGHML